jgi:sugar phosphate isomerase/epimerase
MKLAVFTVSLPEYDPIATVKILGETGYDGVEWRVAAPAPAEKPTDYTYERRYWSYNLSTIDVSRIAAIAPGLKSISDAAGLEICSLTTYLEPWQEEEIESVLAAAQAIGCPNIRVNVPKYNETENYRSLFGRTREQLGRLEQLAGRYGTRINFEIHMGNIIPSASAAFRLVSGFDPRRIGIIFDPGNMVHEGYENYRLGLELLGEYLAHVHIKNALWRQTATGADGVAVWQPTWATLKQGVADLRKLIRALKAIGYDGYLSIEDFSNEADTATKVREGYQFLKELINE